MYEVSRWWWLTAAERARRERVRLQAAQLYEQDVSLVRNGDIAALSATSP